MWCLKNKNARRRKKKSKDRRRRRKQQQQRKFPPGECEDYYLSGDMNEKSVRVLAPTADRWYVYEWATMRLQADNHDATLRVYKSGKRWGRLSALREIALLNEVDKATTGALRDRLPRMYESGTFSELKYSPGVGGRPIRYETKHCEEIQRPYTIVEYFPYSLQDYLVCTASAETNCQPMALSLNIIEGCITALSVLHRIDIVHRGVSPNSFAVRLSPHLVDSWHGIGDRIVLTDTSLARKYPRDPQRRVASFVGSPLYCSAHAHSLQEHRPSDDYVSVAYMLMEMLVGRLPWASAKSNRELSKKKRDMMKTEEFMRLPRTVRTLLIVLNGSGDTVDLSLLYKSLDDARKYAKPDSDKPDCVHLLPEHHNKTSDAAE